MIPAHSPLRRGEGENQAAKDPIPQGRAAEEVYTMKTTLEMTLSLIQLKDAAAELFADDDNVTVYDHNSDRDTVVVVDGEEHWEVSRYAAFKSADDEMTGIVRAARMTSAD